MILLVILCNKLKFDECGINGLLDQLRTFDHLFQCFTKFSQDVICDRSDRSLMIDDLTYLNNVWRQIHSVLIQIQ